ncbi:3682_t:CDS:2 [Ambispora gerdemannii]|uniref:3682_t:CDS:1 n=1 Tax=Ambispora gerdemannii TaxID=144530 RepID=A0A9N9CPM5_9GLOM|nr:3682_t:CDS:2 [Ambispora gerdemannii]
MAQLQVILDRLVAENLHGPVSSTTTISNTSGVSSTVNYSSQLQRNLLRKPVSQGDLFSAFHQRDEEDMDDNDPRWLNLFIEYFLENSDTKNDDLLFFVRQTHSESEELDPVFVKRKSPQPHIMPPLEDAVLWKETFFLNLIVQLPCKLTVAVCTRTTTSNDDASSDGGSGNQKTSMTCSRKHVSKRVYALPTKPRMDAKETSMECSYPLIYYVIDDYEEMFEHLIVTEGEYLCVELAVTIPRKSDVEEDSDEEESDDDYYSRNSQRKNRRSMTNGPFPQPCNDNKITLFQGAASYSSLLEIYKQKSASKLNRRFKMGPVTPPTEYVMMRGPGGKGHAQACELYYYILLDRVLLDNDFNDNSYDIKVAITATSIEEEVNDSPEMNESPPSSLQNESPPSSLQQAANFFRGHSNTWNMNTYNRGTLRSNSQSQQRTNTSASFFQSLKRLSLAQLAITDRSLTDPESLKCCMTFVNVPWTSIVSDLTTYARKKNLT